MDIFHNSDGTFMLRYATGDEADAAAEACAESVDDLLRTPDVDDPEIIKHIVLPLAEVANANGRSKNSRKVDEGTLKNIAHSLKRFSATRDLTSQLLGHVVAEPSPTGLLERRNELRSVAAGMVVDINVALGAASANNSAAKTFNPSIENSRLTGSDSADATAQLS